VNRLPAADRGCLRTALNSRHRAPQTASWPEPRQRPPGIFLGHAGQKPCCNAAPAPGSVVSHRLPRRHNDAHRWGSSSPRDRAVHIRVVTRPRPGRPRCALAGHDSLPAALARTRRQAVLMYALLLPALTPFVLLGTVMGLSWFEDRILPRAAEPTATAPEAPRIPAPGPMTAPAPAPAPAAQPVSHSLPSGRERHPALTDHRGVGACRSGVSGRRPPRLAAPGPRRPRVPQGVSL
jgi:hypothetical protein